MFGISTGEFIVIALIGIVVLGPERSVEFFRQVGKAWRSVRAEIASAKSAFDEIKK